MPKDAFFSSTTNPAYISRAAIGLVLGYDTLYLFLDDGDVSLRLEVERLRDQPVVHRQLMRSLPVFLFFFMFVFHQKAA